MAIPLFPPLSHPVQDRKTGLITQPWALYFQSLTMQAADTGSGDVTAIGDLTAGQLIIGAGGTDITVGNLTGDVTTSGTTATTIANNAVTYAKIQDVSAAERLLGRGQGAGAGDVQEISLGTGLLMTGTVLSVSGSVSADYVVAGDGVQPPTPIDNGAGSFVYVVYTP